MGAAAALLPPVLLPSAAAAGWPEKATRNLEASCGGIAGYWGAGERGPPSEPAEGIRAARVLAQRTPLQAPMQTRSMAGMAPPT
jgi:hypothetical protein